MLFNSYEFMFGFLPITFIGFVLLSRYRPGWRSAFVALASVAFYCWWDVRYLWLLLASITFNYAVGYTIGHSLNARTRKILVTTGVVGNLAALGYFKYAGFLAENVRAAGYAVGAWDVILPLGISFYTFTQLAFIVDVYRGSAREYSFTNYLLFVCYFPHLIAGPIMHHSTMMPQFEDPARFRATSENVAIGTLFFLIGMAKKVVLADTFAGFSDPVFNSLSDGLLPDLFISWMAALSYALQLYFDFSGYCDMAIGISLLFGIMLPLNFNSPYKATSIIDFWRRWHMTLSAFLRQYLYFSLGGGRRGPWKRYRNLMLTMLLGGLWHGASWTFVIWGGLHGLYLVANHGWRAASERISLPRLGAAGSPLSLVVTFLAVTIAWVFFRAETVSDATRLLTGLAGGFGAARDWTDLGASLSAALGYEERPLTPMVAIPTGLFIIWVMPNTQEIAARGRTMLSDLRWSWMGAATVFASLLLTINSSRGVSPFIYFNF